MAIQAYRFRLDRVLFEQVTGHFVRLFKFGLVGLSGLAVNSVVLYLATGVLGVHYLAGAAIATQASTGWNFLFSDRWVFFDAGAENGPWRRFGMFWLMNNIALLARWPILFLLTSVLGVNYLISNLISLVVLMVARYALSYFVIWGTDKKTAAAPAWTPGRP